jgi:hypothetical protein
VWVFLSLPPFFIPSPILVGEEEGKVIQDDERGDTQLID